MFGGLTTMKTTAALLLSLALLANPVYASGDDDSDGDCQQAHEQCGHNQGQDQGQSHDQTATRGAGNAANEVKVENNTSFSSESNNTNVVLVPNNNTSGCMRVWGISFGGREGAAALGIPTRDEACDLELAADDAAAIGQHDIAWFWRCHKKNLYKQFDGDKSAAIQNCHSKMMGIEADAPVGKVILGQDEYDNLILAQVQQAEVDELEDKYMQQQMTLEELQKEVESYESEQAAIDRLKREAAALRAKQEEEEARRALVRERYAKKAEAKK